MNDKVIDLLPCPFCGAAAIETVGLAATGEPYRVECNDRFDTCPMNMCTHHYSTREEARAAWNHRSGTPFKE